MNLGIYTLDTIGLFDLISLTLWRRDLLKKIGENYEEENGKFIVTNAYNLKAKYIFHTIGPQVIKLSEQDKLDLKNCYLSSLEEASRLG